MIRLYRALVALLDRRERGTALALFRIAVGIALLVTVGDVVLDGVVELVWVDHADGGYRSLGGNWLVDALGGPTANVMWRLVVAALASGVLVVLGVGGRPIALLALQLHLAVTSTNGHATGSYDLLLSNALWLVVLGDCTATLSVDCRATTGRWTSERLVPAWPRYLVIFQLFLMYWSTGLQKLSAYWAPGGDFSALYYILQQPAWQRFDNGWAAWVFPVTQVGTAVTWLWEVGAPVLLLAYFWRYTADRPGRLRAWANRVDLRSCYAAVGVLFHLLVMALMSIGPFTVVTLAYYLALYHPDEYRRLSRRARAT